MPRYHFHTVHGPAFLDQDGEVLADLAAARRKALQILGEILRDGSADYWEAGPFRLVCTAADGTVVLALSADRMSLDAARTVLAEAEVTAGADRPDDAEPGRRG